MNQRLAWGLSLAGALPFIAGPLVLPLPAVLVYGAVILSFVGAVHWGWALAQTSQTAGLWRHYVWSVLPALLGWVAVLQPRPEKSLAYLMFGFALAAMLDGFMPVLPAWYRRLRLVISALVLAALGFIAATLP